MKQRTLLIMLVLGAVAVGVAVPTAVAAPPTTASVTIRHQVRGCHSWSVDGGAFAASQALVLARGGSIRFTDNDLMLHTLVQLSGPAVRMRNGNGVMNHMGATTTVVFARAGTYVFKTKAGEDYVSGVKTVGEDNVLRLTVKVR
jgi:hypothetical protein